MKTADFHYYLPEELIAQHPAERRDASRLLVADPNTDQIEHQYFYDIPRHLRKGDCLVLNNTKVLPARLLGQKRDNQLACEFLLLKRLSTTDWEVLLRPGRRLKPGTYVDFIPDELSALILEILPNGNRLVRFFFSGIWEEILYRAGRMPLPPYIKAQLEDASRYNTVYAKEEGSAAAPTAGLHFTPELLTKLQEQGIRLAELTLHVGLGTFRPVQVETVEEHVMHSESFQLSEEAVEQMQKTKEEGGRIIAVGTTSTRVLETVASRYGQLKACSGETDIFLYPSKKFRVIDALVTNFHLPESTLLMLISALAGREFVLKCYEEAVRLRYRFFSFGDAMLLYAKKEAQASLWSADTSQ